MVQCLKTFQKQLFWSGFEAGSAHGQYGELWHAQPYWIKASMCHLDVKWLWTQEAVQGGRFSLNKFGTYSNVSDLTAKHHDEERLKVWMIFGETAMHQRTRGRSLDGH